MTPIPSFNLPARLDPEGLDYTERVVAAGVLRAAPDLTTETIAALRGSDFESVALETVVRAVDRTIRAGRRKTPASITSVAVEHGVIRQRHEVEFERLLHDLIDGGMGDLGTWQAPTLIFRSGLRSLLEITDRAEQVREIYQPDGPWFGHSGLDPAGASIAAAPDLADALDGLAQQLQAAALRLRTEVAPRDEFTARRLATRPGVRLVRQAVSA